MQAWIVQVLRFRAARHVGPADQLNGHMLAWSNGLSALTNTLAAHCGAVAAQITCAVGGNLVRQHDVHPQALITKASAAVKATPALAPATRPQVRPQRQPAQYMVMARLVRPGITAATQRQTRATAA